MRRRHRQGVGPDGPAEYEPDPIVQRAQTRGLWVRERSHLGAFVSVLRTLQEPASIDLPYPRTSIVYTPLRRPPSVSWNLVRRDLLLSASWDDTIRMWDVERPGGSVRVFPGHTYCVYAANWSPQHAEVFLSASGDGTSKVWDLRQPGPSISFMPHPPASPGSPPFEVLTADWCKYNDCIIATGSVDKTIKIWDLRNLTKEVAMLEGHNFAVRRLQFSPHRETLLVSCSYDMSVCFWDFALPGPSKLVERLDHHTEFAVGVDFSVLQDGLVASTGWDDSAYVWRMGTDPRSPFL